jgi:hypothetical protein
MQGRRRFRSFVWQVLAGCDHGEQDCRDGKVNSIGEVFSRFPTSPEEVGLEQCLG